MPFQKNVDRQPAEGTRRKKQQIERQMLSPGALDYERILFGAGVETRDPDVAWRQLIRTWQHSPREEMRNNLDVSESVK